MPPPLSEVYIQNLTLPRSTVFNVPKGVHAASLTSSCHSSSAGTRCRMQVEAMQYARVRPQPVRLVAHLIEEGSHSSTLGSASSLLPRVDIAPRKVVLRVNATWVADCCKSVDPLPRQRTSIYATDDEAARKLQAVTRGHQLRKANGMGDVVRQAHMIQKAAKKFRRLAPLDGKLLQGAAHESPPSPVSAPQLPTH